MTNQEAFDTMVRHLRRQGCRSQDEAHQTCLYRGPNGLKCAVGALIPDEEYMKEWDEKGVRVERLGCRALDGLNFDMLAFMQFTHDHISITQWEYRFVEAATRYGLTIPPLEAAHA